MLDGRKGTPKAARRAQGGIERRGNSLRVKVYAGTDPLTGKRLYLTESTTDKKEAERLLTKLRSFPKSHGRDKKTTGTIAEIETKARRAGMTTEQWIHAKNQAAQARSRSRGVTTRAESKLAG